MKNMLKGSLGSILAFSLSVSPAFANEPGGGYEGITAMYYFFIGIILAYGAYDIFFKKS
ncbi:MAG: hypothetical protein JSU59_11760 [Nitrospirota bacterium]|nr:MAG: hypothetical protein JSU59_11760 [Nitrospirota bacterium]